MKFFSVIAISVGMMGLTTFSGCDQAISFPKIIKEISSLGEHHIRRNILVLVDASSSITTEQQNAYITSIEQAYRNLQAYDRLVISTIDGGAYTNPVSVIREDFLTAGSWEDLWFKQIKTTLKSQDQVLMAPPFIRKEEIDEASGKSKAEQRLVNYKANALPNLRPLLEKTFSERKGFANATNILWAIQNLQADLEDGNKPAFSDQNITVHNYLLILSDMVEESSQVSFNKPMGIMRTDAEKLLQHLHDNNQLPALNGSHIICIGRAKTNIIKSEEGLQSIAEFWNAYFSKTYANGNIVAYEAIDKVWRTNEWLNEWKEK